MASTCPCGHRARVTCCGKKTLRWQRAAALPMLLALAAGSFLTAGAAGAAGPAGPAGAAVVADWPRFHHDDAGSGYNPYENILSVANVARLTARWALATSGAVESSPAVAGGVVYIGSDDGHVYALKAATGARLWAYDTGAPVVSSPAVSGGVVYVGAGNGTVYALRTATGARVWSRALGATVVSSPAVAGGLVYVGPENDRF